LNAVSQAGDVIGLGERVNIEAASHRGDDWPFPHRGIGPRDFQTHDPLGGHYYLYRLSRNQYSAGPAQDMGSRAYGFTDFGALAEFKKTLMPFTLTAFSTLELRMEYSRALHAGIRRHRVSWKSPFGLVRVNVAYPFLKQSLDKGQILNFISDLILEGSSMRYSSSFLGLARVRRDRDWPPRASRRRRDGSRPAVAPARWCRQPSAVVDMQRVCRIRRAAASTQLEGERRKIRDQVSKLMKELSPARTNCQAALRDVAPSQNHCETALPAFAIRRLGRAGLD